MTEADRDQLAAEMGLVYKLVPSRDDFAPLYVRSAMDCGPVMRMYPDVHFDIIKLEVEQCTRTA